MADTGVEQAQKMAGGNISALLPQERNTEQERLHRKQNLAAAFRVSAAFACIRAIGTGTAAAPLKLYQDFEAQGLARKRSDGSRYQSKSWMAR